MQERLRQLETSILELGTEVFRLKHQMMDMHSLQDSFAKTLVSLKGILDENGLINSEDFELTMEANALMDLVEPEDIDSPQTFVKKELN